MKDINELRLKLKMQMMMIKTFMHTPHIHKMGICFSNSIIIMIIKNSIALTRMMKTPNVSVVQLRIQ